MVAPIALAHGLRDRALPRRGAPPRPGARRAPEGPPLGCGTYTIADIALFGWIWRRTFAGVDLDDAPNVARWLAAIEARPAVRRAVHAVEALVPPA